MKARHLIAIVSGVALMTIALLAMGREPWCRCGYVKIWHGVTKSAENSQHLFDWYTFTHLIHGFGFYWALSWLCASLPVASRLVLATAAEAAWEVFENTSFVIERYRTATVALDYYGDSVVNSAGDVLASLAGFAFAALVPAWTTALAFVSIEAVLAYAIRDNLTLNVLMLAWPIEAIRSWQSGR